MSWSGLRCPDLNAVPQTGTVPSLDPLRPPVYTGRVPTVWAVFAKVQSGTGSGPPPVRRYTMSVPAPPSALPSAPWHRTGRRALASLLLLLCLAGCTPRTSGGPLPDRAGTESPSPVPTVPTFTPIPPSLPTPTFVHAVPLPTPSLTVSEVYDNRVEHADGRYALQLSGARVAATFATACSPVQYWARDVAAPLFTVPEGFRPPYSILRTVEGHPVRADGTPDPDHPEPRRFLLRVDPDGDVHYVDDEHVEGVGHLAYSLDTVWGTTPAANDRAVLEVLDRHWFRKTLLSAVPPPVQFEIPAFGIIKIGTISAAMVGAFVTFDADGRVTALGAPLDAVRVVGSAPPYNFHGPLLPELGQLHRLEHLDLGYQARTASNAKQRSSRWALTGAIPPQLWRLPRLRHLDLQGQRLVGTLPSDIGLLVTLEYLDLGNNWLSGSLPSALERLASLEYLDLGGNDFTEPLPPELGRLVRLKRLDLSHGQLTEPLPPELGQLTSLQRLDLSDNWLSSDSFPPAIGDLASLESLDLSSNRLTDLPPELGQLASLEQLDLGYNQLTALPPAWGQLTSLLWLDLSYNQLTGSLLPEWGQLANLEDLNLHGNQLTGPLPPEWDQLDSLESLSLSGNQLTGSLPPAWGQPASLLWLDLSYNQLTGPLPPEWGQLDSLQQLQLEGNRLTGPLPPEWGQLASLEELSLSDNQLMGPLPPEWGQLVSLSLLNLYNNRLTGPLPPGRLHLNWWLGLEANQLAQVVLVPGGRQPLVGNAHLEGAVLPQQIVGDASEDGHVVGCVARTDAAVVLAQGHVQDPVVSLLDGPVTAHRLQQRTSLGRQAGNEATDLGRDPVATATFTLDPDQAGQVAPLAVGVDMGEQGGGARRPAAADFDAAVVLPDGVRVVVGAAGEVSGPFQGPRVLHPLVETLVVGPHAPYVVGPLLPDRARNRLLATHGIEGHNTALQAQHAQPLRDGRDFVGLVIHRGLGQHQAVGLRPGAHPVQRAQALTPVMGTAYALAVDRHDLALGQGKGGLHPVPKARLEPGRVQPREDPPQRVVRGDPVRPFQEGAQPGLVALAQEGDGHETVGSADHGQHRQHQDVRQGVQLGPVDPRILLGVQHLDQGRRHRAVHEGFSAGCIRNRPL